MIVHSNRLCRAGALAVLAVLGTGCVAHRHTVGLGPTGIAEQADRQYYVFFGLVPWNEVNVQRMASDLTSYSIESEYSFVDFLMTPFLLPFTVTSRTVTVRS